MRVLDVLPCALLLSGCETRAPAVPAALRTAAQHVEWEPASALQADLDCDGEADTAYLGRSPSGAHVGIVRARVAAPEVLSYSTDPGVQASTGSADVRLEVESLDYDPTEAVGVLEGFQRSSSCKGLVLGAEDHDRIHIFWNGQSQRFSWWRM